MKDVSAVQFTSFVLYAHLRFNAALWPTQFQVACLLSDAAQKISTSGSGLARYSRKCQLKPEALVVPEHRARSKLFTVKTRCINYYLT